MSNVVSPKQFAERIDAAALEKLREDGLVVKSDTSFDDLDLPEPEYGDHILGKMDDAETELYVAYHEANIAYEDYHRELGANTFTRIGEALRNKTEKELQEQAPMTEEQASTLFRLQRRAECLRSLFLWNMCEKYNCHEFSTGVRTGRRFVKRQKKW